MSLLRFSLLYFPSVYPGTEILPESVLNWWRSREKFISLYWKFTVLLMGIILLCLACRNPWKYQFNFFLFLVRLLEMKILWNLYFFSFDKKFLLTVYMFFTFFPQAHSTLLFSFSLYCYLYFLSQPLLIPFIPMTLNQKKILTSPKKVYIFT